KIKEQTRKLAAGCSKHCFEVVDETDEVSNYTYGKVKLTWFEEIFEEYEFNGCQFSLDKGRVGRGVVLPSLHT
ncbi:hypothetical protein, partial [Streptococcus pseudopneumoniae]|uniref:hypothetical protein n=1 Tax=Streptococcus pseudopneumoniae TaxID=257758 RepID=UPI00128B9AD5